MAREADRRGAPKPKDGPEMKMTSEKDLEAAFRLLDSENKGSLTLPQAVDFLICAGWCLPEEELEDALCGGASSHAAPQRSFSLPQLLDVLRRMQQDKENISVARLSEALQHVADDGEVGLDHLAEVVCKGKVPVMSEEELEELLGTLGVFEEELDCQQLAQSILQCAGSPDWICTVLSS
ncbi:unnamed protein product [Effrenium voratum]|uniref:EF-hand domain-containing protein n=1 Tax=Effrenium voratum TaxID=2562239 RepID=A0AA36N2K9_9DINO|nr:unnamed protein product [Effrenium voratum]CAJ1416508.1 unnamed protein product [Effrenium voratum]